MAAQPFDYSIQPYTGTDIVALALGIAAVHCLTIRLRDHERGMGWFGLSMGSLAVWAAFNRLHLPSGPELDSSPWWYVMCIAMAAMAPGLVAYLDVPARLRGWVMGLILLPSLGFAALVALVALTDVTILRVWVHLLTATAFTAMGAVTLWASRREPGAGHLLLGLALLSVPALAVFLVVTRTDPVAIRYWAVLPALLVGVTLPTVSVMRRQRALQAEVVRRSEAEKSLETVNESLEAQVDARTVDLQGMVVGLESFNRSVSHDLRGPLGGIAGLARMADTALKQGDDSLARQALPVIADQAEKSTGLVIALLELARVGDVVLDRQQVDTEQIAHQVIDQVRLSDKGGSLPQFVVHTLPPVHADPALLRAVLGNLIGNAVKFTRDRHNGRVEIGAGPVNGHVCLQVRDNGVGFDADAAAQIFAPFHRLHGERFEGHGIGLSIVRRAVERHGGKVWAEATPGQGACFSFTLPSVA